MIDNVESKWLKVGPNFLLLNLVKALIFSRRLFVEFMLLSDLLNLGNQFVYVIQFVFLLTTIHWWEAN